MRLLSALCLFAVSTTFLAADDKKPADDTTSAKVQAIGLSVRKALPAKPGTMIFMPQGVTMDLSIAKPGKFIVGVDAKASKLESFTDDKNNSLYKKPVGIFGAQQNWINEYATQYGPEAGHCTIQIAAGNPPGKGAGKIQVKASLVVQCGAEEKTADKKEIAIKTNEEVSVGDFKVKVNFAGGTVANLSVLSPEPRLKSVEFFDAAGKAIKPSSSTRSNNPFGPGGKPQSVVSYFLNGKMEKVSFKVTYFTKVESVTIPLDLKVGLDLE